MRAAVLLGALVATTTAVAAAAAAGSYVVPPAQLASAPYPDWAHRHWVWLSADRANQSSMLAYAQEYMDHNIPVGAVDIDSTWSTGINNFVVDTAKYPDAQAMVAQFHAWGIRCILWVTSMVDTDSSNYADAVAHKYYVANAAGEPGVIKWWHGHGVLLDYTNPDAVRWWHDQMDAVLALGIDGWKTDGTDPYLMELLDARSGVNNSRKIAYREYADLYYGDFFDYTRQTNGPDALIMSRPVDGFAPIYLAYSPRRVVFAGWTGDNDPTWSGLVDAMKKLLQSGWNGYPGFGCDIGGYRRGVHAPDVFTRWFQLGAFVSLMENGGDDEHRPWMFDPPGSTNVTDTYRRFAMLHTALLPYLLTTVTDAYESGGSSLVPLAPDASFQEKLINAFDPPTYDYFLGASIFVSPIATPAGNVLSLDVSFPAVPNGGGGGDGSGWINWFDASRAVYPAGQNATFACPMDIYPAFYCVGCLIPLEIEAADWTTDKGLPFAASAAGAVPQQPLTLLVNRPRAAGGALNTRQSHAGGVTATYAWTEAGDALAFTVSALVPRPGTDQPLVLLLEDVVLAPGVDAAAVGIAQAAQPALVAAASAEALAAPGATGYFFDAAVRRLFVRPAQPERGVVVTLRGVRNAPVEPVV